MKIDHEARQPGTPGLGFIFEFGSGKEFKYRFEEIVCHAQLNFSIDLRLLISVKRMLIIIP